MLVCVLIVQRADLLHLLLIGRTLSNLLIWCMVFFSIGGNAKTSSGKTRPLYLRQGIFFLLHLAFSPPSKYL